MIVDAPPVGSALMVGEAHHRFFNSLQLIVAATNGIMRGISDPAVRESLEALQSRVVLLAEVNRRLAGPFGPDSISIEALERLCAALVISFERPDTLITISVDAKAPTPERCRIILLLFSELLMNALKHGAIDQQLKVRIKLTFTTEYSCLALFNNISCWPDPIIRPRIATEIADLAGGTLAICTSPDEYGVVVTIPNLA